MVKYLVAPANADELTLRSNGKHGTWISGIALMSLCITRRKPT